MRVLVTGAASGIGRATCLRLARDAAARGGAKIAAVDIAPSAGLDTLRGDLEKLGATVLVTHADLDAQALAARQSVDASEGRRAMLEKRKPNFRGE